MLANGTLAAVPAVSVSHLRHFLQVMKADLLDGDQVTFEDSGSGGGGMLANETVLGRGLVVRSRGNWIQIRLRSRRPQPGSMLLRYQGKSGSGAVAACLK